MLSLMLGVLCTRAFGAPFQNLDFQAANTNNLQTISAHPVTYIAGLVSDLVPGWQLYDNSTQIIGIAYNSPTDYGPILVGEYALYFELQAGHSFSIVQHGDVPLGAIGLTYAWTGFALSGFPMDISINGIPLQSSVAPYYDVSAFAGQQNVELRLATTSDPGTITFFGTSRLDDISFIIPFVESDFNGDGVPDVVFEHQDGFVGAWFMNKGPDLISASFFNPVAVADPRWHIVGTGSFMQTNKTDLLFQHEDGTLAVWSMDGTNLVSTALLNPSQPGEGWKVVGTGDMNHDGKKDILFQHTDGTLAVWFMDRINLVQGALLNPNTPGDTGWRVVGTANLSSVGTIDLIFQHSDGTLAAWYMDGTNLVRGALLNPSAPAEEGWRVAATLDLNGDRKTDLLFQHDDGTMAVWLMDGINLISGQLLNPANPGSGWRIAGPR